MKDTGGHNRTARSVCLSLSDTSSNVSVSTFLSFFRVIPRGMRQLRLVRVGTGRQKRVFPNILFLTYVSTYNIMIERTFSVELVYYIRR